MDMKSIFEQLLQSGQELANKGQGIAEEKLGVPSQGQERDAMVSGMGKGAMAAGALALLLGTNTGRRLGGAGLKLGSLAAIGGLAYKAYQSWSQDQQQAPEMSSPPVNELEGSQASERSTILLKAMIAAAKADGHIDEQEQANIQQQMEALGIAGDAAGAIQEEISKPLDPAEIAALADDMETAAEIYLTSLMVIDADNFMEKAYLQELAKQLNLAPELVAMLEAQAAGE